MSSGQLIYKLCTFSKTLVNTNWVSGTVIGDSVAKKTQQAMINHVRWEGCASQGYTDEGVIY